MKISSLKKAFLIASILAALGYVEIAQAIQSGAAVIDSGGTNAGAVDLARVTCNPDTAYLGARITDQFAQVPGLWLSLHIYKGSQMKTTTDSNPGDANPSPVVILNGGPGAYYISATKTAAGARSFLAEWACMTDGNIETGSSIEVLQFK